MPDIPPSQREELLAVMSDGNFHTLVDLSSELGGKYLTTSISARIRELRNPKFGGWKVERIKVGTGQRTFAYRIVRPVVKAEQMELAIR